MPTSNENQANLLRILMQNVDTLGERWPGYKDEFLELLADIVQLQKDFEFRVSGSIVPKIEATIDAHARQYDDQ